MGWNEILNLLETNRRICQRILQEYHPKTFKLSPNENIEYYKFKRIIKAFGEYFTNVELKRPDLCKNYYTICNGHITLKYLIKLQKYCSKIESLTLKNLALECIDFKSKWPMLENLKQLNLYYQNDYYEHHFGFILKYLSNIEILNFRNVQLEPNWSLRLQSDKLREINFYISTKRPFTCRNNKLDDWQKLFDRNRNIEIWNCEYIITPEKNRELKLDNLKTLSIQLPEEYNPHYWIYLKNLPKLENLFVETNSFIETHEILLKILQNTNIKIFELEEKYIKIRHTTFQKSRRCHFYFKKELEKLTHIKRFNLNTFYKQELTKSIKRTRKC